MGLFGSDGDGAEIKIELTGAEEATKQAEKLNEQIDKLGKTSEDSSKGFGDLERQIIVANQAMELGKTVATALMNTLKFTANALLELAEAGDKLGDLEEGFQALGGSSVAIEQASDRINGILPNIDLLRLANKAMVAGIPEVNKNFGDIAEYGRKMADALGLDATQGIEQLTQALVSGRPVALKQLGIMIDSDKANADYAKSMGIVGRELSDLEKKTAGTTQALEQMRLNLGKMPATADSVQDGIDAIKAKFTNLIGETGKAINENEDLTIALRSLANTISTIDIKEFASDVAWLASKFVNAADGLIGFVAGLRKMWKEAGDAGKTLQELSKDQEELTNAEEEHQQLMQEQAQLWAEEKKRLKGEADAREVLAGKLKDEAEARKENEKATKALKEAQDKAYKGLQGQHAQGQSDNAYTFLGGQLEQAILSGNEDWAYQVKDAMRQNVTEGIIRGYEDAGGVLDEKSLQLIDEMGMQQAGADAAQIQADAMAKIFQPSNFFLGGLFGADKTPEQMKGMFENMSSALESSVASAITLGLEGGFNSEAIAGLAGSLGSAIGTSIAGPIGGALMGAWGSYLGKNLAKLGDSQSGTVSAIGAGVDVIFPGVGSAGALGINALLGGSKSPNEEALQGLDRWIEETLATNQETGSGTSLDLGNLQTSAFSDNPNWADDMWSSFDERAVTSFSGLGQGLTQIAGVGEDVGGQLGYILANNLNGNLDQARMLLIEMGIGAQDLEQAFLQIGLTGDETWHTVETYMQSIGDLTGEGLVGIGDLEGAMNQFIDSGGRGQEALIAIRNIGIEGMEAGAESMESLRAHLVGLNKFTTEQISAIMTAFGQRGIDSLGDIADASDRTLGGVTADAESLGFAWSESIGQGLEDSIDDVQKLKDVIDKLPDTVEKNIVLKVKTEYSGEDARMLYNDLKNSAGVPRQ